MNGLDKSKKIIKRKPLTEKQAIQIMTKRRACIEKFRKTLKKAPIKAPRKKKEEKEAKVQVVPQEGEPEEKPKEKKKRAKKAPVVIEEAEQPPVLDEASIVPPEEKPKEKKKRAKKVPSGPIEESVVGELAPIKEKKPRKKPVKNTNENPENIL